METAESHENIPFDRKLWREAAATYIWLPYKLEILTNEAEYTALRALENPKTYEI